MPGKSISLDLFEYINNQRQNKINLKQRLKQENYLMKFLRKREQNLIDYAL